MSAFQSNPNKEISQIPVVRMPGIETLLAYQDLYFSQHGWTILHLLAIFQSRDIIKLTEDPNFKVPFLVDNYGKTPFHYILSHNGFEFSLVNAVAQFMADHLNDINVTSHQRQKTLDSLTELFPFIIARLNQSLVNKFLSLFYSTSSEQDGFKAEIFGKAIPSYTHSEATTLGRETFSKLHKEGNEEISFKSIRLNWDYNPSSEDMLQCASTILSIENETYLRFPVISHLVNHLWKSTRPVLIGLAIFYSILMTLISVYIGIGERNLPLEIIILVQTGIAVIMEFLQVTVFKMKYFMEIWNWVDLAQHFLVCAFIITRFVDDDNALTRGWLVASIVIVGYSRWLSYLRLFRASSKLTYYLYLDNLLGTLIQTILSILRDMWGFLIIMFGITIGFSLIFLEFGRQEDNLYLNSLYGTYQIWYGNFDDSEYSPSQKILTAMILFILSVVLLNMLIAIMGNTYDEVQEKTIFTDTSTRLSMCLEAISYLRLFKRTSSKGYLIFYGPKQDDDNQEELHNEWERRMKMIKKALKQLEDNQTNELKKMREAIQADVKQEIADMKQETAEVRQKIDDISQDLRLLLNISNEPQPNHVPEHELKQEILPRSELDE